MRATSGFSQFQKLVVALADLPTLRPQSPNTMKVTLALLALLVASCSAFAPSASLRPAALARRAAAAPRLAPTMELETEDMWWGDKEYPDSKVLGIGRNVPSAIYGPASGISLAIGCYCVAQSNLVNILSGSTVNGFYVAGSILVIYSWGLHVACWIQRQNGK